MIKVRTQEQYQELGRLVRLGDSNRRIINSYNDAKGNLADARSPLGKERRKFELNEKRDNLVDTFVDALTNLF